MSSGSAPARLRVEVVAIGDELLSGARVNTNAAWIGQRLATVGAEVVHGSVVGDEPGLIVTALREACARADVVITTGGLGPTNDDRTFESLGLLLGQGMRRAEDVAERLRRWYESRGRAVDDDVLRQADVPVGSTTLPNPVGSAPGLRAEVGTATVFVLPGVPVEMRAIVDGSVLPWLAERSGGATAVASLRVVLVPESEVARTLTGVEERAAAAGVAVAYLPSAAEVVVRLVGPPGSADVVAELEAESARLLGDTVAVRGDGTLALAVVQLASAAGVTVAAAESLTGGSLTDALTTAPGASAVVRGGVVAYATDVKATVLGVDGSLLADRGAVDADVARQLAQGVRTRLGATWGVGTTGVAGPAPQDGHPPGVVHVAVAGPDGTQVLSLRLRGDRDRVRLVTVTHALDLLRRGLLGLPARAMPGALAGDDHRP